DELRLQLKNRKVELPNYAEEYYNILQEKVLLIGTNSNDRFEIIRRSDSTVVRIHTNSDVRELSFHRKKTKELWIYGLTGEDTFEVTGSGNKKIRVRLMGGSDNDHYHISNGDKVIIYDFKSQPNDLSQAKDAKLMISDSYQLNSYNYEKPDYNVFGALPYIGYNPDDGVKVGAAINYTVNNFNRDPFTHKHTLNANYFFATNGYELRYKGNFPKALGSWNFIIDGLYTSPNFSLNFFGFGNQTRNYDASLGMDYNRVK